jgi:hypothetical protein
VEPHERKKLKKVKAMDSSDEEEEGKTATLAADFL